MLSTMVFFMHCCTSKLRLGYLIVAIAVIWLGITSANAESIEVRKVELRASEDGYQLAADFNITLSFYVEQALIRGLSLNFVSDFNLTRSRWYWLDEVVSKSEQNTKLSYNALTRQYRIARGTLHQNFDSLEEALAVLGHQASSTISASQFQSGAGYMVSMLKKEHEYSAYVRLRLDTTQLPKPLQVNALAGDDWSLDSNGYSWVITPAAIAAIRVVLP